MRMSDWSSDVCSSDLIADEMEDWYRDGACDGFMVGLPIVPVDLDSFTQEVVPELQRRGLFRREYSGGNLRAVMGKSDERRVGKEWVRKCSSRCATVY